MVVENATLNFSGPDFGIVSPDVLRAHRNVEPSTSSNRPLLARFHQPGDHRLNPKVLADNTRGLGKKIQQCLLESLPTIFLILLVESFAIPFYACIPLGFLAALAGSQLSSLTKINPVKS